MTTAFATAAEAGGVFGGADVSALLDIERDGGIFLHADGRPGDEIGILRQNQCEWFRVRLFVDPNPDRLQNYGATQGLDNVRRLGQRIKSAGGKFLLDFHYSDTWADPQHQIKPKAWAGLALDELERKVGDYTATVLADLRSANAVPDMVQVGNEITPGLLWPEGRVSYEKTPAAAESWQRLARLLNAGAKAVRASEKDGVRIPIVLHVHGGGRPGVPQSFFDRLKTDGGPVDYDVIGLSFYPTWNDSLDALRANMHELAGRHGKQILLAEVAYPWTEVRGIEGRETMHWPQSPAGQADYLRAVRDAVADVPGGRGIGYVWWYSDSIRVNGRPIWRDGAEALFDRDGSPLPAMKVFAERASATNRAVPKN